MGKAFRFLLLIGIAFCLVFNVSGCSKKKVTDEEMRKLDMQPYAVYPTWDYTLKQRRYDYATASRLKTDLPKIQ